jgi:hypothetical protein
VKQSIYVNVFVKVLGELASKNPLAKKTIDEFVLSHVAKPILQDIDAIDSSSMSDYDYFCARNKAVKLLLGEVMFVVACIRSQLSDAIDIDQYANVICKNLILVRETSEMDTMLDVIETFLKASKHSSPSLKKTLKAWVESVQDLDIMTTRAQFKLMDIMSM